MLVAVMGAQGVGKTTLLNEINMLDDYYVDNFKVSRSVQKSMGFAKLADIFASFDIMKKFQETVIDKKFENDTRLSRQCGEGTVSFVERSFYDILAYAELNCHKLGQTRVSQTWLDGYKQACLANQSIYRGLILIEPNEGLPFEHDHERAEEVTQRQIADRMKELCSYSRLPVLHLKSLDIDARVRSVVNFIEQLEYVS